MHFLFLTETDVLSCSNLLFILILVVVCLVFTLYFVAFEIWTQETSLLDRMCSLCFIIQTFSIAVFSLFRRLQNCTLVFGKGSYREPRPFDMDFIRSCVQIIQIETTKYKRRNPLTIGRLVLFLILPVLTALGRLTFNTIYAIAGFISITYLYDPIISFSSISYGCFWYIVYLQRISLQHQFNRALRKLRQLSRESDRDRARRLIDRIYSEYHTIRKLMGGWMAMTTLTVSILSIYTIAYNNSNANDILKIPMADTNASCDEIPWKWHTQSHASYDDYNPLLRALPTFSICLMWAYSFMFCLTPVCALGSINLEYLWQRFRHVIIRSKIDAHESFWLAVEQYAIQIDSLGRLDIQLTLMFPVVGVFVYHIVAENYHNIIPFWISGYMKCTPHLNYTLITNGSAVLWKTKIIRAWIKGFISFHFIH